MFQNEETDPRDLVAELYEAMATLESEIGDNLDEELRDVYSIIADLEGVVDQCECC